MVAEVKTQVWEGVGEAMEEYYQLSSKKFWHLVAQEWNAGLCPGWDQMVRKTVDPGWDIVRH